MTTGLTQYFDSHLPTLSHMYNCSFIAPSLVAEARTIIPIDFEDKSNLPKNLQSDGSRSLTEGIRFCPKKLIKTAAFVGWLVTAVAIGIVATIATAGAMPGLVLGISFIVLGTGMIVSQLFSGNFKERKFTLALNLLFGALTLVIGAIAAGGILSPFVAGWIVSGVGMGAIGLVVSSSLIDAAQSGIRTYLWHHKNSLNNTPVTV